MDLDRRIRAGVNMDGSMWGPVVQRGLDRPFGVLQGNEFEGAYATHSFTDFVWVVPQLGADPVDSEVGTIDPATMARLQNTLLRRFFDAYTRG